MPKHFLPKTLLVLLLFFSFGQNRVFAQTPNLSINVSDTNPLPGQTITLSVTTPQTNVAVDLYAISLDFSASATAVCSCPGKWLTIAQSLQPGQTTAWQAPLLGRYYLVANLIKDGSPLCTGAFS